MGRNKIAIETIKEERIRQVTFYKRKRGLLKKAMELSLLCNAKCFLCITDKNENIMIYSSDEDYKKFINKYCVEDLMIRENYSNSDVKN